jgi:hypothetical protein
LSAQRPRRRPTASQGYQVATRVFAVVIVGFGLAILVVTLVEGGGPLSMGFLLGLLFTALGAARFYLSLRG